VIKPVFTISDWRLFLGIWRIWQLVVVVRIEIVRLTADAVVCWRQLGTEGLGVLLVVELDGSCQSSLLFVGSELDGTQIAAEPLGLVADQGRVEDARLYAQKGHVVRAQGPLGQELTFFFSYFFYINFI